MYNQLKFNIFILFCLFIISYQFNNVLGQHTNPIYANHFFSLQFFKYFNESKISIECKTVTSYVKANENEDWALKLIDSSGVVGAGLAKGNYQFMGDFDECVDISVKLDGNQLISEFHGQYCTLNLPLQTLIGNSTDKNSALDIEVLHLTPTLGICLPSACTQTDLIRILSTFSTRTNLNVTVSNCVDSQANQIEWYHIMIISGFLTIIFLIIIGTLADTTKLCIKSKLPEKFINTLKSFSFYTNTVSLFSVENDKGTITCFHGFRLISLLFIILYHIFTVARLPSANLLEILEGEKDFMLQIISNAGLWVEAFFLLSGFLCANGLIHQFWSTKTTIKYNPILNIIHRYIRLTPSLLGIIGFSIVQELMATGPQWFRYVNTSVSTCHRNWWTNILYINNIVGLNQLAKENECLSYTWYLAVDMQLFLISPILILFLASNNFKKQLFGIAINILTIILSCTVTAIITVRKGLTPTVLMTVYDLDYINQVYKQTYCRAGPYCVGILMAYLYNKYQGKIVIKPSINIILWTLSISLNLSITFLTWPWLLGKSYHNWASVLYASTHRTLWALSWAYMLFACSTSNGSIVNRILSWKALVPLSRLSFQAYLFHSVLISRFVYSARQPFFSSNITMIMMFFQYTVLTFVVSYFAYLMFEIPFSNLERLFSRKKKSTQIIRRQVSNEQHVESINLANNNNNNNNCHQNYGTNTNQGL